MEGIPVGYSPVEIEGELIRNNNFILIVNDADKTQCWVEMEMLPEEPIVISESGSSTDKTEKRKEWTDDDTFLFIHLLEKHKEDLLNPKYKKKTVFENISKDMKVNSAGKYNPTPMQCDNRYKSLMKKFREITDYNETTGHNRQDWKFYDSIANLLGDRPNVQPVASCSSLELQEKENVATKEQVMRHKLSEKLLSATPSKRGLKEKQAETPTTKRSKVRSELLNVVAKMEQKAEQREKNRVEMFKEQHEDLKTFMTEVLKLMKNNHK